MSNKRLSVYRNLLLLIILFHSKFILSKEIQWNAQDYASNSFSQFHMALSYFQKLRLLNPQRILDVGCGDGKITAFIAQEFPYAQIIGIDNSGEMISFARKNFGNVPNLTFEQISADQLSYDQQFDVIVSFFCLHWVNNQDKALRAIVQSASVGADILLLFSIDPDQPVLQALRYANIIEPFYDYFKNYEIPVHPLDLQLVCSMLKTEGCNVIFQQEDVKVDVFSSADVFYKFLYDKSFVEAIPKSFFGSYVTTIVNQYLIRCPVQENGAVFYSTPIGIVHAKKDNKL